MMLAVNHLGPFLLTDLLLPLLRRAVPSRIVTVASEAHKFGRGLDLDDIQANRGYGFMGFPRYGETKLMNILFTRELARRIDGTLVTANCLHPGAVRTNLGNPPKPVSWLIGKVFLSPEEGAATSLAVATADEFSSVNGTVLREVEAGRRQAARTGARRRCRAAPLGEVGRTRRPLTALVGQASSTSSMWSSRQ